MADSQPTRRASHTVNTVLVLAAMLFAVAPWPCSAFSPQVVTGKPLPQRILVLAMARGGKELLALAGDALFVVDPQSLALLRTIEIKRKGGDPDEFWSADNMAVSPDGTHVLVLNRYIHVATGKSAATLDVAAAIRRGMPRPVAMDISPDGSVGLVLVDSFLGKQHSRLALFDLKTGKLIRVCVVGNPVTHAVFADPDRLLAFHDNHEVTILGVDGKIITTLTKDGPRPLPGCGAVVAAGSGKDRIVTVYGSASEGQWQVAAINPAEAKVLFRTAAKGGGITTTASGWVLYQTTRMSKRLCECGQHHLADLLLKARNTNSGVTREVPMHHQFDQIVLDTKRNALLCAKHNGETVTAIPLPAGLLRDKPGAGQADTRAHH